MRVSSPALKVISSFIRLLPRLLVTSISPFIFPSITCFRRQFLRQMWPIQLAFRFLISCRIFLCSLTLSNTSSFLTWSVQLISILLQHHIAKLSRCFCCNYVVRIRLYLLIGPCQARWTDCTVCSHTLSFINSKPRSKKNCGAWLWRRRWVTYKRPVAAE